MALLVRLALAVNDRERFENGVSFGDEAGVLKIWDSTNKCIGMFAPGQWVGVVVVESRQPAKPMEPAFTGGMGGVNYVYIDGRAFAPVKP